MLLCFALARHLGKDAEIHYTGTTVVMKPMLQAPLVFDNAQRLYDFYTWLKPVGNQGNLKKVMSVQSVKPISRE